MTNACIDCRWYDLPKGEFMPVCKSPKKPPKRNMVTGEMRFALCCVERMFDSANDCGESGKFFEKIVFTAETKKYDPDEETHEDFNTEEEAFQWLRDQQKYGSCAMWINNQRVEFEEGKLAYRKATI